MVCNSVIEDRNLSLKAKGLYLMIKHYITIPGFVLNKGYLQSISTDGERSFESGWKELKEAGYLIQYRLKGSDGKWVYEYELLHEPLKEDKKDKKITKKPTTGKVADYNNSVKKELENKKDSYNVNSNKNSIPQNNKINNKSNKEFKPSYSLNPKKILQTKWKDTYLANAKYKTKEVVTIGLGSCLGGFIGGAIFDKDKKNIKAKAQEGVAGLTNIALPVAFVETMLCAGKFISKKTMPNWLKSKNIAKKAVATTPQITGALGGLAIGMVAANKVSNKINEVVFKQKENRSIKKEDFAAHVDDICVAATLVADKNPITNFVARFIPAFLMVAGIETGNKQAHKM
jgi:hypothetical protein